MRVTALVLLVLVAGPLAAFSPPDHFTLLLNSVAENAAAGTPAGYFGTNLFEPPSVPYAIYTYTFEAGTNDNDLFVISGNALQVKTSGSFDYETMKHSYEIHARTTDQNGGTMTGVFTVSLTDANEVPTDIALSNRTLAENLPAGTSVGTLAGTDPDAGDSLSFSLPSGQASNALFAIGADGRTLETAALLDYEGAALTVRVRATDLGGLTRDEDFAIILTDVNDAPTAIALVPAAVAENSPAGTVVGSLGTTDQDAGDGHTYAFVDGANDNALFVITGASLGVAPFARIDYEYRRTLSLRVRSTDRAGASCEADLTLSVTDLDEAPDEITLSNGNIDENLPAGSLVGVLSSRDPDAGDGVGVFSLPAGKADNSLFAIGADGRTLVTAAVLDYEEGFRVVRVRVADATCPTLTFERDLVVSLNDVNEAPTAVGLFGDEVDEGQPAGTLVGALAALDDDAGDSHTFHLEPGLADNDAFRLGGAALDELQTAVVLDHEAGAVRVIRVRVTDSAGNTLDEDLQIRVLDRPEAPTAIEVVPGAVAENEAPGRLVGVLVATDPDAGDFHDFWLVAGEGDADNASFEIASDQLVARESFDHEAKAIFSIRVRARDAEGLRFEGPLTVTVDDVNDAPTNLRLSSSRIPENRPAGTAVGTFACDDQDALDRHAFTLVEGEGSTDNGDFSIDHDGVLRSLRVFDAASGDSFSIRVRATDDGLNPAPLFVEASFMVEVGETRDYPMAWAGPDQTLRASAVVTLDGTQSHSPWGPIVSHSWTQLEGSPVVLSAPGSSTSTFETPAVGPSGESLVFQVHVVDDEGTEGRERCVVNLVDENLPPVAVAGEAQLVPGGVEVTLSGLASYDPDGLVVAHLWEQVDGPGVALSDPAVPAPTFVAPVPGAKGYSLNFRLTVRDDEGLLAQDRCLVVVSEANLPPVADAGADHAEYQGDTAAELVGVESVDADGTVQWYRWRQRSGHPVPIADPGQPLASFSAPDAHVSTAPLIFELVVGDDGSLQASDLVTVALLPRPPAGGGGGGGGGGCSVGAGAGAGLSFPGLLVPFLALLLLDRRRAGS